MKVRSIPAQITTVEDKIAGNLNFTQILLLMIPLFWIMIVFVLLAPSMHFVWYKLPIILVVGITSLILSLRIKEKLVLNWLLIFIRYNSRPKYYIFNKNDTFMRTMDIVSTGIYKKGKTVKSSAKKKQPVLSLPVSIGDLIRIERLLTNPKYSFSITSKKKGGLHVAFEQKQ